ncbi:DUF1214 domain-containing protein [Novosphingobium taihuense]|uniref:DUF1214 domain-containing protein n=1 Tax=Novosphingobium taihuense TaxID=260085 RepID=A0A7W7EUT6_9SPHN|nr:DUF1214 domain-containing protein [Novosphingobium taihuense]MBB4614314.1 hypothetical protein [Novosphingobium taihuense]TWH87160.1 uncharacterized protein DUF1214 [Novosphingobium taihuense]
MQTWSEYVDLLKRGETILAEATAPVNEQLRADLFRQFSMNLAQAYFLLMMSDPRYPEFVPYLNSGFMLQPNPDAVYYVAKLDGTGTYRITGERGNAPVAGFATGNKMFGTDGLKMGKGFGNYDLDDLTLDDNGRFSVIFSAERPRGHEGDWLYLDPASDFIMVRQFSYDWGNESDVRLAIERLDPVAGPKVRATPAEVDERLRQVFDYAIDVSRVALAQIKRTHDAGFVNQMHIHTFQEMGNGKDWPQAYFEMVFDIAEDEALVIESDLPETRTYWNVQVIDGLWNQVDIPYRQSSLNGLSAKIDPDGKFRAVLSHEEPGYANWLDTGGSSYGMLIGRWYRCSSTPTPQVRKMKLSEVPQYLGDKSARATTEERAEQLRHRLVGNQMRRKW